MDQNMIYRFSTIAHTHQLTSSKSLLMRSSIVRIFPHTADHKKKKKKDTLLATYVPNTLPWEWMRIGSTDGIIKIADIKIVTPIQPPRQLITPYPTWQFWVNIIKNWVRCLHLTIMSIRIIVKWLNSCVGPHLLRGSMGSLTQDNQNKIEKTEK